MDLASFDPLAIEPRPVAEHRAAGGRVVGYACTFTPVEILDAAGLLPYRLRGLGRGQTDGADARMSRFNCRFCRSCLQLGLDGHYDFLDGLVETNGCDQLRGMFENWRYALEPAFFHYLKAPHAFTEEALSHFALEIGRMRGAVVEAFGTPISDEALGEAADRQQRIRARMEELLALRAREPAGLTGAEGLQVMLLASATPPDRLEPLLGELLSWAQSRALPAGRARVVVGGAATDEPLLFKALDDLGLQVVGDTLCFGTRAVRPQLVEPTRGGSIERILAERYLRGSRCPRLYGDLPRRLAFVRAAVSEGRAGGVVLFNNKFCDLHGFDNALLRDPLEAAGVPVLILEKDYGSQADLGRVRTRLQAFRERIGGDA